LSIKNQFFLILDWVKGHFMGIKFLSEEEIIDDLLHNVISDYEQAMISITDYDSLIRYHMTLGMFIRNKYNLWDSNNPLIINKHPDDVSFEIIQSLWKRLQEPRT